MGDQFPDIVERKFRSKDGVSMFRVMQWNILADGYSLSSPTENFCAVPQHCLPWSFRYIQIMKHIEQVNADVICLEEVDHFEQIEKELETKGYKGDFMVRKDSIVHHGIALFYKTSTFDIVETFKEYVGEENSVIGNQGLLIKVLSHKTTNQKLIVGVIHLKAKRQFLARRLAQTESSLEIINGVSVKYEGVPIIWAGDFNGETNEPFHKAIIDAAANLKSSYSDFLGSEPEFTTWKIRPTYEERHTIDYIWYTSNKLKVNGVLLPMEDSLVPNSRYPSPDHPSDHISVCTDFQFA